MGPLGYEWNPWAVPWSLLLIGAPLLGFLIYRQRPHAFQNRLLALMLVFEGITIAASGGIMYFAADAETSIAWQHVGIAFAIPLILSYPVFLTTLPTPLTRWIPRRAVMVVAAAAAVTMWIMWFGDPGMAGDSTHETFYASHEYDGAPFLTFLQATSVPVFVVALMLAGYAIYYNRHDPILRRQAIIWFVAFGVRDLGYGLYLGMPALGYAPAWLGSPWMFAATMASTWVFLGLLTYGVLTAQMFGADLKVKLGISRGTVAAVIAGAAIVGGEVLERLFGADQLWSAVAVGAVTALAFRPLARLGDRLADRTMPSVSDTKEYRGRRARELYRAAVADARGDGEVTRAERAVLDGLAQNLGLAPGDVRALEAS